MDSSELKSSLNDLKSRIDEIRDGTFNVPEKERRLKEIGVDVSIRVIEWDSFINQFIKTGDFDVVVLGGCFYCFERFLYSFPHLSFSFNDTVESFAHLIAEIRVGRGSFGLGQL